MYTYPKQAIQLLLEGYAAPSTSAIRARSIETAKVLFARYTAILQLDIVPAAEFTPPNFTPHELETVFPFALHTPRPGEPSIAAPVFGESGDEVWLASENYTQRRREFVAWTSHQPDSTLLLLDDKQRYRWLKETPTLKPETFFDWWRERKYAAKLLIQGGQERILNTFWTDNRELRIAAPQRYVQDRILAK